MRAERLPPQHDYRPSRCARGLRVVCHARGARLPLFRRSQFHTRAALIGAYTGRDAEWARLERYIIAAGREGRVLGADFITK